MARGNPPTKRAIAEAWGGDVDACFACGWVSTSLQRAHLVPHALGGSDTDPENFALLCGPCHRDAPDVDDAAVMVRWIDEHESYVATLARAVSRGMERAGGAEAVPDGFDLNAAFAAEYEKAVAVGGRYSLATHEAVAERVVRAMKAPA